MPVPALSSSGAVSVVPSRGVCVAGIELRWYLSLATSEVSRVVVVLVVGAFLWNKHRGLP